jgi:hypothetical protein
MPMMMMMMMMMIRKNNKKDYAAAVVTLSMTMSKNKLYKCSLISCAKNITYVWTSVIVKINKIKVFSKNDSLFIPEKIPM